jgi:hypothetical protein
MCSSAHFCPFSAQTRYRVADAGPLLRESRHRSGRGLLRLESYGSQDTLAAAMKEGGAYADLFQEMAKFIDQDRDANWSNNLYKAVTDTSIWGDA